MWKRKRYSVAAAAVFLVTKAVVQASLHPTAHSTTATAVPSESSRRRRRRTTTMENARVLEDATTASTAIMKEARTKPELPRYDDSISRSESRKDTTVQKMKRKRRTRGCDFTLTDPVTVPSNNDPISTFSEENVCDETKDGHSQSHGGGETTTEPATEEREIVKLFLGDELGSRSFEKRVDTGLGKYDNSTVQIKADIVNTPQKRNSLHRPTMSTRTRSTATMLRIQREWKDAVQSGVAFDWIRGKPVALVKTSKKQTTSDDSDAMASAVPFGPPPPQHVWLGPISPQQWWIWHFSFTGLEGSAAYAGGVYHGRIVLPQTYPAQPPRVQMLTETGRFQTSTDICLSASNYHPETWQPAAWSVRSLVEAVRLHMITASNEIGGITTTLATRQRLAEKSRRWKGRISDSGVEVDHARMIQAGWIAGAAEEKVTQLDDQTSLITPVSINDDTIGESETTVDVVVSLQDVEIRHNKRKLVAEKETRESSQQHRRRRRRQDSHRKSATTVATKKPTTASLFAFQLIVSICRSPVRMVLMAFCILFLYLNK